MANFLMIFGKPRYLGVLKCDETEFPAGTSVIVQSARGEEIAVSAGPISPDQEDLYREQMKGAAGENQTRGGEPPFQDVSFLREAVSRDISDREDQREAEDDILCRARAILRKHDLKMKLVDVEYLMDRKKLFFYFTAEQRIDFRAYVRDLAREFKTRIELRQIGVRDESKVVKGMAPCGQPCCCSYWLNRFEPICIKMVKEQNLALNPSKISGICGRLMCCMGFEHSMYRELWQDLPNPGTKVKGPEKTFTVAGLDIATASVRMMNYDTGELMVPVSSFEEFRQTVQRGEEWKSVDSEGVAVVEPGPLPGEIETGLPGRVAETVKLQDESCEKPASGSASEETGKNPEAGKNRSRRRRKKRKKPEDHTATRETGKERPPGQPRQGQGGNSTPKKRSGKKRKPKPGKVNNGPEKQN